jgi:hypothetical protein
LAGNAVSAESNLRRSAIWNNVSVLSSAAKSSVVATAGTVPDCDRKDRDRKKPEAGFADVIHVFPGGLLAASCTISRVRSTTPIAAPSVSLDGSLPSVSTVNEIATGIAAAHAARAMSQEQFRRSPA